MSASSFKGNILAGAATTFTGGSLVEQVLVQAGVTMTGTDAFACSMLDAANNKSCGRHDEEKERCNQGVGNGAEGCDPGNSNQGDDSNSNDETGGTPGNPGRKGSTD